MRAHVKRWLRWILTTAILDSGWPRERKILWVVVSGLVFVSWIPRSGVHLLPPYFHVHDFAQEWSSARNFYVHKPIYMDLKESFALHFKSGWGADVPFAYNAHPPTSILLALPFGKLDYDPAYLAWNLASLLALGGSLWLIVRSRGLGYSPWSLLPMGTLLLISEPFAQQMRHGQLNLFLLLMITGAWTAQRAGRFGLSGVLVGTAAATKLFPGLLFFYFLARRQWRSFFFGVASFIILIAATASVLGWESLRIYVTEVLPSLRVFTDRWGVASLTGFWSRLFHAPSGVVVPLYRDPALATIGIVLCSVALVAVAAWKTWRARSTAERDLAFALWGIAMLLVAPLTWPHAFLLLVLPLALMWKHLSSRLSRALILGFILVVVPNPRSLWNLTITGHGDLTAGVAAVRAVALPIHALTVLSYQFYALLALFLFALFARPERSAERGP